MEKTVETVKTFCTLNGEESFKWIIGNIHYSLEDFKKTYDMYNIRSKFNFNVPTPEIGLRVINSFLDEKGFVVERPNSEEVDRIYVFQYGLDVIPRYKEKSSRKL